MLFNLDTFYRTHFSLNWPETLLIMLIMQNIMLRGGKGGGVVNVPRGKKLKRKIEGKKEIGNICFKNGVKGVKIASFWVINCKNVHKGINPQR